MLFYVSVVTFLKTLLINKFISIVIPTLQVWHALHPKIYVINYYYGLKSMKSHVVSDSNCSIVNL